MRKLPQLALVAALLLPRAMQAQHISDEMMYEMQRRAVVIDPAYSRPRKAARQARPDHVNNAETPYFPTVFNQDGGSCEQASKIGYIFNYELNAARRADGSQFDNQLPTHFSWLMFYGNTGAPELAMNTGIPNAPTYGGRTYSALFGNNADWESSDAGWMTGYEKWYSAMFNRASRVITLPALCTPEGREAAKNYLWNHNGDESLPAGGLLGVGVAGTGITFGNVADTPANREAAAVGKDFIRAWGTTYNHSMTLVGYDDRLEFDFDGNGIYGEEDKDEKGAWIMVNSWGDYWCDRGFVYCPYKFAVRYFDGALPGGREASWTPILYEVRRDYRPLRTIRLRMNYSRRSELLLGAGVSADLNATEPDHGISFEHFQYSGDGRNGKLDPAPEVPMLGRWADGQLHDEPMEFGYDLTDLTDRLDPAQPLKYFFTIDTRKTAVGEGRILDAAIIDYAQDERGVEVPFGLGAEGVTIENQGKQTVISVVVPGRGLYAPQNAVAADGVLSWQAPQRSAATLTGYRLRGIGTEPVTLDKGTTMYTLPRAAEARRYTLTAVYGRHESTPAQVEVDAATPDTAQNRFVDLRESGFTIPDVFGKHLEEATIEFWACPHSLKNWNQAAGPGWGQFMMHANEDGSLSVGWDQDGDKVNIPGVFIEGNWKHVAVIIKKGRMSVLVNGLTKGGLTSKKYSGIGGFGDLTFRNDGTNAQDMQYDEIRIWNRACTRSEITARLRREFAPAGMPEGLMAYYKGDLINADGRTMLRDHSGNHRHATLLDANYTCEAGGPSALKKDTTLTDVEIRLPQADILAGVPVRLSAQASAGTQRLLWTAEEAGVRSLQTFSPTLIFKQAGTYAVSVTAQCGERSVKADTTLTVKDTPAPDATFRTASAHIKASDHVTLLVDHEQPGHTYRWSLPGAQVEEVFTPNAAATYEQPGTYTATLTVSAPDGRRATASQDITVEQSAPLAAFSVQPAIVLKGEMTRLTDQSKYAPASRQWQLVSAKAAFTGEGSVLAFRPEKPGIYDITLTARNESGASTATEKATLVVCNADSRNGLSFLGTQPRVELTQVPFAEGQQDFTIEWWMHANHLTPACNAIGESNATLRLTTDEKGAMTLGIGGQKAVSPINFVTAGSWHHYAVSFHQGAVSFYRDGEAFGQATVETTAVPRMEAFRIGSVNETMRAQIDEFRIWGTALAADVLRTYINQPITDVAEAKSKNGLLVYYNFNQSGGDVQDATSHANHGRRIGFGPDGDAWGLSRGVFCLNLDDEAADVTDSLLLNYKAPFANNGKPVNPDAGSSMVGLSDWTLENTGENGAGAHVDVLDGRCFAIATSEFSMDDQLTDHKVYQTLTLPAGAYRLTATFHEVYKGEAEGCHLVAAAGRGLPDTDGLDTLALGHTAMQDKSKTLTNSVTFVVPEEGEVSLGIVANMGSWQHTAIQRFTLESLAYGTLVNDPTAIDNLPAAARPATGAVYDLAGNRVLRPRKGGVYIIGGQKVMVK